MTKQYEQYEENGEIVDVTERNKKDKEKILKIQRASAKKFLDELITKDYSYKKRERYSE